MVYIGGKRKLLNMPGGAENLKTMSTKAAIMYYLIDVTSMLIITC